MKIIGYARVSSKEQQIHTNALEQQVERLKEAGAEKVYIDVQSAYKGGTNRKSLDEVMNLVRSRQVEIVVVTRLDRLTRNSKEGFPLLDEFFKYDVGLKALDEPIDLTSAAGKLSTGMIVLMAQHHSDQKSEMVKHGWNHFRSQNKAFIPPFGYKKVNERFVFDKDPLLCLLSTRETKSEYDIALEMVETYIEKRSQTGCLRVINEKYGLNAFSYFKAGRFLSRRFIQTTQGLSRWLKSPVLRGHTQYLKTKITENTHLDILITDTQWKIIEQSLEETKTGRGFGIQSRKYPVSGLLYCGYCRAAMYSCASQKANRKYEYYQCKNWQFRSCQNKKLILQERVEDEIIFMLVQYRKILVNNLPSFISDAPEESPELKSLKQELNTLIAMNSSQPLILDAIADITRQITEITQTTKQEAEDSTLKKYLVEILSDPDLIMAFSNEDRRTIYRQFVSHVFVKDGMVEKIVLKI
jgi:site-specific DNA recombinase